LPRTFDNILKYIFGKFHDMTWFGSWNKHSATATGYIVIGYVDSLYCRLHRQHCINKNASRNSAGHTRVTAALS